MAKAKREIKTTLAVDGEKEFDKAIKDAGRSMRVMASEMKAAAADFDLTGNEMEFLGKKSEILKRQMAQQADLIRTLEEAVADSAKAYGEASAKTDGYRIKLNNARAAMAKLKKEAEESNREMSDLGRDAGRVGRQLETGLGEAADDVSDKIDSMVNTLDKDLSGIGKSVNFSAFKDGFDLVKDGIGGTVDAIAGLVEGTVDYRRTMSFLEQNALREGMDPQIIKDMTLEVSALTGDLGGAVEGMSNLLAAGFEEDELATAIERLKAAVIEFPDTLKFESLADSLQESVATGQAVGQYAEYLERMGVDLDDVNKSFKDAAKQGPEAVETVALAWLNNPDAEKALEIYKEMNQGLLDGQKAQQAWDDELARSAEILEPYVTKLSEYRTQLLGYFNEAFDGQHTINGRQASDIWWLPKKETKGDEGKVNFFDGLQMDLESTARKVATWFDDLFDSESAKSAEENGKNVGKDIAQGMSKGMDDNAYMAANSIKSIMADLQAEANLKPIVIPIRAERQTTTGGQMYAGTQGGNISVSIGMDGKTFGTTTASYTDEALGARVDRYEMYG